MKRNIKIYKLSQNILDQIVSDSTTPFQCLLNLYKQVYGDSWDKTEHIYNYPWINSTTAHIIIEAMEKKFNKEQVLMLWLNKGFSSNHNELKDWQVLILPEKELINLDI